MSTPGALVLGGDYQGLGIVRSLGRRGVATVVVDDERSIARASRWSRASLRVPALRDDDDVLRALRAARTRFGLEGWVVFPTRDENVATLSRHRDALGHWRIPTPGWDSVRVAWDKRETYRLAAKLGVPAPRTWFPLDEADLDEVTLDAPVIVKPAIKENFFYATRAKAWRADTRDELLAHFRRAATIVERGEILVQELVPGDGRQQYSYCALVKDGVALASMGAVRRRQHPSDFGRASTFVETAELPELAGPALRFLREIGYYGLVELEYKRDPRDGAYKLLDVNARTWGYHSVGAAAGVDFPYLLYRDQVGAPVETAAARPGVRWIRLATDVPNALVDIRAGRLRPSDWLRTLRGIDTEAVFSWRDPLPGLYEIALLPYLAVKRGL